MLDARKLKQIREQKGWTQADLGLQVGQDGAYIRKLERGNPGNPGCQTLARLARALGVTADDLIDFDAALRGLPPSRRPFLPEPD